MNGLSKILISIIGVLVIGFVGILLYIYWPAITGTVNGSKYYTSEDVQEAYDEGYNDGNESKTELTAQVEYYKTLVDEFLVEVELLNKEIDSLNVETTNNMSTIDDLNNQKLELVSQVENLQSIKNENEKTISSLTSEKTSLQTQVNNLQDEIANKELIIESLNLQISTLKSSIQDKTNEIIELNNQLNSLQSQLNNLQNDNSNLSSEIEILETNIADKQSQIDSLNLEINNLEESLASTEQLKNEYYNKVSTLEDEIEQNLIQIQNLNTNIDTLKSTQNVLNERVTSLNSTIEELNITLEEKNNNILRLNDKISKLTENLLSLQTFIVNLQLNDKCVATFEYNEDIYNIQVVEKNSLLNITNPADTDYIKFNGWTINGEIVDLSTYQITANTTFVADLTYIYDVEFIYYDDVDGVSTRIVYDSQKVEENSYVDLTGTLKFSPKKDNYIFDGWTIDGKNNVDVASYPITSNMTFIAKFITPSYVTYTSDTMSSKIAFNPNQPFDFAGRCPFKTNSSMLIVGWNINGVEYFKDLSEIEIEQNKANIIIKPICLINLLGGHSISFNIQYKPLFTTTYINGSFGFDIQQAELELENYSCKYYNYTYVISNIRTNTEGLVINSLTLNGYAENSCEFVIDMSYTLDSYTYNIVIRGNFYKNSEPHFYLSSLTSSIWGSEGSSVIDKVTGFDCDMITSWRPAY